MNVFIYDHDTKKPEDANYFASFNYLDEECYKWSNYIYINSCDLASNYFEEATDYLSSFSGRIHNNRTIKEILSIDGLSLWWFYEISLRMNLFQYIKYKGMMANLFNNIKISLAVCDISDPVLLSAIRDFCREKRIEIKYKVKKAEWHSIKNRYQEYMNAGLTFLIDLIISRLYDQNRSAPVLIASYTNYWTRYNITKEIKKDGIFDDIQKKLDERNIRYIGLEYNNESLKNYIIAHLEKRKYSKGKWLPLNTFATMKSILLSLKIYKKLNNDLSQISVSDYKDEFIQNMLIGHIKKSFFLVSEILSLRNAISLLDPKIVLTSCEYCKMGRAAMAIGNEDDLQTVALQHGIITPTHWGYIFSKSEKISRSDAVNYRPIPRYTLLYGPDYAEILTKNSIYPEKSLIITGQPRYDYLYDIIRSMDKDKFLEEKKLKHPLIVWISQFGYPQSENRSNIDAFMHLIESIPVNLYIKPHPSEIDLSIYQPLLQHKNVVLSKDINLYKLLNVCDLIITKNSTTAIEAAALNKPIIVLNLSGEPDVVDYVKEGIALGVYDKDELIPTVKRLLEDDSILRRRRNEYISRYLYKMDGSSSQRVADFLEKLL
jgi:hypothetical protein